MKLTVTQDVTKLNIKATQESIMVELQPVLNQVIQVEQLPETDPIFTASEAHLFVTGDKVNLDNQSGINSGDETTNTIQTKRPLKTINSQSIEGGGNIVITIDDNVVEELGIISKLLNTYTFLVGFKWKINGAQFQNLTDTPLTIAEATTGFKRIDIAVLTTSNTIEKIQGVESNTIALQPLTPTNTILLTSWNIDGASISEPTDPVVGDRFIKKSDAQPFQFLGSGSDAIIPLSPLGSSEIRLQNPALVSIAGFDLSLIIGISNSEVPYQNKPYRIRNLTGNSVIVKNELIAADSHFFLTGGSDLIIPNKESLYVTYDASGFVEAWRSWSSGGSDEYFYINFNGYVQYTQSPNNYYSRITGIQGASWAGTNVNMHQLNIGTSVSNILTMSAAISIPFDCILQDAQIVLQNCNGVRDIEYKFINYDVTTGSITPVSPVVILDLQTQTPVSGFPKKMIKGTDFTITSVTLLKGSRVTDVIRQLTNSQGVATGWDFVLKFKKV